MRIFKQIIFTALLTILGVNFSSCKFGPNFSKQAPKTNAHFLNDTLQTDSTSNISWWEMFKDP
ncbi:MAG: hypothetical protein ACI85Q_002144, partial [Salibacteraceae bacterium]